MTDFTPPPTTPIQVNQNPKLVAALAALRILVYVGGTAAATLGATALAGKLNAVLLIWPQIIVAAGALATLATGAFGVFRTWREADDKKRMEPYVPNTIATKK